MQKKIDQNTETKGPFNGIERFLKEECPKLLPFFRSCYEVCQKYGDYKDVYVAAEMGCTRAKVGQYKKQLGRLIQENGLLDDYRPVA